MSGTVPVESLACQRLREADAALHALNTGASIRTVRDQNGEEVSFSTANRAALMAHIRNLQSMCSTYQALALVGDTRPSKFLF